MTPVDQAESMAPQNAGAGDSALDARYGRTPERRKWNRRGAWAAAAGFVVVLGAWVIWGGLDGTGSAVSTLDTGFEIIDENAVSVSWQVTLEPGDTAECAIQAQNDAHGVVGWKLVPITASDVRSRTYTEVVNTTEQAVTGLIYRCWLT
ncbi:DUF4307 domain-containing protein [Marisediminicola senii]|uniref:DUF4307 domain-containing protein n=1 Tax=Marisediminicola senii TaxID=2711233 RepID=UPI0013E9DE90|nr:DUF4307 domain-containing protein [Marisediminicola senii]